MRRLLPLGLVLALVPAAGAATVRTVVAPAPVTALASDTLRIAYATGFSARDCNRVFVWNLVSRNVTKLGRKTHCEQTSTGNAVDSLAIAGSRVLWVHYAGGNIRDWSLWTATTSRPTARLLRRVSRDAEDAAPILVGPGDNSRLGDILPYAVGREVVALRVSGSRRFAWTAPARVVALAALGGELAVATEGGRVTLLDIAGHVVRAETFSSEIKTVRLTGHDVLVHYGRTIELMESGRSWRLPLNARLEDARDDSAYYVAGGALHELRLVTVVPRDRVVGTGSHVQVEGLVLSTSSGRRVTMREPS